jgi:hypothetical protein
MPAASAVGSLAVGWAQIQTKTNQNKTARDEFTRRRFFMRGRRASPVFYFLGKAIENGAKSCRGGESKLVRACLPFDGLQLDVVINASHCPIPDPRSVR